MAFGVEVKSVISRGVKMKVYEVRMAHRKNGEKIVVGIPDDPTKLELDRIFGFMERVTIPGLIDCLMWIDALYPEPLPNLGS